MHYPGKMLCSSIFKEKDRIRNFIEKLGGIVVLSENVGDEEFSNGWL